MPLRDAFRMFDLRDTPRWLAALDEVFDTHGDLVRVPMPGQRLLASRDPDVLDAVLQGGRWDKRGDLHKYHRMLMGDGLVTARTHDAWRRRRRAVGPLFAAGAVDGYVPRMAEGLAVALAGWPLAASEGEVVDAHRTLRDATTRINVACFLRRDFDAHIDELHEIMDVLAEPQSPVDLGLPTWVPTATLRKHRRVLGQLDAMIGAAVARRRAEGDTQDDYLTALLRAADEDPEARLDDRALRDEVVTLLVAGHETTASGLAWTLYELADRPDLQDRIAAEAASLDQPSSADLATLQLTTRVIWEGLRLYPPVMVFVPRENEGAVTLGEFDVPDRSLAFLFVRSAMRRPDLYADPDAFDPDRYEREADRRAHDKAWMPFSAGRRRCPAEAFAMAEMQLALAEICGRWRFARAGEVEPRMVNGALMPVGGVPLSLTPR